MNIFALHDEPKIAAQMHLDKHVVKMIIEYAQLLSTAHRLIDGRELKLELPTGKTQKLNILPGESFAIAEANEDGTFGAEDRLRKTQRFIVTNPVCYAASHMNHPCGVWARLTDSNYLWLYKLFEECAIEYTHRYGKQHKTYVDLKDFLGHAPRGISPGGRTPFPQAMGDEFKVLNDSIQAYRNYYLGPKTAFAKWTNRPTPDWFKAGTKDFDVSHFERTR